MLTIYPPPLYVDEFLDATLSSSLSTIYGVFFVTKTGTINQIGIQFLSISVLANLQVSLQTVANNVPTGTYYGGSAPQTWTPAANTLNMVPLTASATQGDLVAIVLTWAGTVGSLQVAVPRRSYMTQVDPWSPNTTASVFPSAIVGYTDGSFPDIYIPPVSGNPTLTFSQNTSGNPDEVGNIIPMPFKCVVQGVWIYCMALNTSPFDIVRLYDVDGTTVLGSANICQGWTTGIDLHNLTGRLLTFTSPVTLQQGLSYTLTMKSMSANGCLIATSTFGSTAAASATTAGNMQGVTRYNNGAWTLQPLTSYPIGLVINEIVPWGVPGASYTY